MSEKDHNAGLAAAVNDTGRSTTEAARDRIYPCADCGVMRSKDEGGTTFTVCDACWDKAYAKYKAEGHES